MPRWWTKKKNEYENGQFDVCIAGHSDWKPYSLIFPVGKHVVGFGNMLDPDQQLYDVINDKIYSMSTCCKKVNNAWYEFNAVSETVSDAALLTSRVSQYISDDSKATALSSVQAALEVFDKTTNLVASADALTSVILYNVYFLDIELYYLLNQVVEIFNTDDRQEEGDRQEEVNLQEFLNEASDYLEQIIASTSLIDEPIAEVNAAFAEVLASAQSAVAAVEKFSADAMATQAGRDIYDAVQAINNDVTGMTGTVASAIQMAKWACEDAVEYAETVVSFLEYLNGKADETRGINSNFAYLGDVKITPMEGMLVKHNEICEELFIAHDDMDHAVFLDTKADATWSVTANADWIKVLTPSVTGSQDILFQTCKNTSSMPREGVLFVTLNTETPTVLTCRVTQNPQVLPIPQPAGTYHGLFVGINKFFGRKNCSELEGAANDACNVFSHCVTLGNWKAENCTILTNEYATLNVIRSGVRAMASRAKKGDVCLLSYSSHGGNDAGSFRDGNPYNGYIVATDEYYRKEQLADDLLNFKSGVRVIIVIDACHAAAMYKDKPVEEESSGVSRLMSLSPTASAPKQGNVLDIGMEVSRIMAEKRKQTKKKMLKSVLSEPDVIAPEEIGWIVAVDYNQPSWDGQFGDEGEEKEYQGEFTFNFLRSWRYGYADRVYKGRSYGNFDGYCSFYEMWSFAKDYATGYTNDPDDNNFYSEAQCLHTNVLMNTYAGFYECKSPVEYTRYSSVPVPVEWIKSYFPDYYYHPAAPIKTGDAEYAAQCMLPSGMTIADAYLAGTTDPNEALKITSFEMKNGEPLITFSPSNALPTVKYVIEGTGSLKSPAWSADLTGASFFRVKAVAIENHIHEATRGDDGIWKNNLQ